MSYLTTTQTKTLKSMLDQRQKALEEDVRRERSMQDDFLDVASEVPDPGDASFASLSVDLGNAALNRDARELTAIFRARSRMEDGSYGECAECGMEIPFERLEAQPTAERCTPCQGVYERTHADAGSIGVHAFRGTTL